MQCPGHTECSGHGKCIPMSFLATLAKNNGVPTPFTYGADYSPSTWERDMIFGCYCDEGFEGEV